MKKTSIGLNETNAKKNNQQHLTIYTYLQNKKDAAVQGGPPHQ